jgi:type IV pilus biogenesis protein PilP
MKPDFALSLSYDGIALLARDAEGWMVMGRVPVNAPNLKEALSDLYNQALTRSPDSVDVKLVIPEAQIKYLQLEDDGARGAAMQDRINRALEAETPYQAHELVCDWAIVERQIHVAAVARETLTQAEIFSTAHGFSPACFVAYLSEEFEGEVFFGAARTWTGALPERDDTPIPALPAQVDETPSQTDDLTSPHSSDELLVLRTDDQANSGDTDGADQFADQVETVFPDDAAQPKPSFEETLNSQDTKEAPQDDKESEQALSNAAFAALRDADEHIQPKADLAQDAFDVLADMPPNDPVETDEQDQPVEPLVSPLVPEDDFNEATLALYRAASEPNISDAPETKPEPEPETKPEPNDAVSGATSKENETYETTIGQHDIEVAGEDRMPDSDQTDESGASDSNKIQAQLPAFSTRRSEGGTRPPLPPRRDTPVLPTRSPLTAQTAPSFSSVRGAHSDPSTEPRGSLSLTRPDAAPPTFKSKPRGTDASPQWDEDPFPLNPPHEPRKKARLFGRRKPKVEDVTDTPLITDQPVKPDADSVAEDDARPKRQFGILPARIRPGAVITTALTEKRADEPKLPPLDEDPDIPPMPSADGTTPKSIDEAFADPKRLKRQRQSRLVGFVLTLTLLLVLAGAAVWASVFLDNGLARFLPGSLRGVDAAETSSLVPDRLNADDNGTLSLSVLDPVAPVPQPSILPAPTTFEVVSETEAETAYVATGIWQRGPQQPGVPSAEGLGTVYTTSIDARVPQPDAVALLTVEQLRVDRPVPTPVSPLGATFSFDLDARGLVRATKQGAISPERFMVYLGSPEAVPPPRPAAAALLSKSPELVALQAIMKAARPKLRPESLSERRERAELSGLSLAELARYRPRPRPITQKDLDEEDTTATTQAVKLAPRPIGRPRDFDRIVRTARAAQTSRTREAGATAQPQTATPAVTITANTPISVARAATQTNALNRRRINVMGIYGTPGQRRATIRLVNGRYVQVAVGDRLDGGRVAAITRDELRYVRSGRTIVLTPP